MIWCVCEDPIQWHVTCNCTVHGVAGLLTQAERKGPHRLLKCTPFTVITEHDFWVWIYHFFSVNIFFGPVQGMGRRRRKAPAYTSLFVCIQWMRLTAWSLLRGPPQAALTEAMSTSDSNDDDWRVRWQHTRPRNAARIDMRKQHYQQHVSHYSVVICEFSPALLTKKHRVSKNDTTKLPTMISTIVVRFQ